MLFNAKAILTKKNNETHSLKNKGVITFPPTISLKVNIIGRLEFKLAYFKTAVKLLMYNATKTPLTVLLEGSIWYWITHESWYVINQRNQTIFIIPTGFHWLIIQSNGYQNLLKLKKKIVLLFHLFEPVMNNAIQEFLDKVSLFWNLQSTTWGILFS